jgi:elongation factor G
MSFKMAGMLAFRTVAPKCRPVILEPIDEVEVSAPDDYLGDVMGDLSSRRGQILGTEVVVGQPGAGTRVRALVPEAELHLYATQLHSLTHGRGTYTRQHHGYEQMPPDAAQKVVEEATREKEAVGIG